MTRLGLPTRLAGDALCREYIGQVDFFPEKHEHADEAKAICGRCLIQKECLAYAIDNNERYGIWGGTSRDERDRIRKAANQLKEAA